ncbi:MAG TPA: indolepyruvate oxidoreductase subunit beta family protein [Burkholderiales bacterium]|jgi:indolepyruvate ferredoxin oxidoreductase beta subunit|nr:indolepyruvate oxidoreductase subunit beta family protein [Burkholderiales bacterium]
MSAGRETPFTLLACALGGEGGGVLAQWLVDTASRCGYLAQSTSIPGVAQRTGATTYYFELFPVPVAHLGGRRPVFSLNPVPGALDMLVSSELLETARQAGNGMSSPERTLVITSSARTLTTAEKMQMADGRVPDAGLMRVVGDNSREVRVLDMAALAREAGTAASAVLLGAIAGSGCLPFPREAFEETIRAGGLGVEASLRGFASAYAGMAAGTAPVAPDAERPARSPVAGPPDFPQAAREMVALGHARMLEYQDKSYGALYLERLQRVLAAERAADPQGSGDFAVTRETARFLALWMAFDDIVRVADLKCRASRFARVRREVKAGPGDLVRVFDHFKPGVPEFAALLPERLAAGLMRWDARRRAAGKPPFALPLKVGTHTVAGLLALRCLAGLRGLRRRGSRYAREQALIGRWLAAVEQGTRADRSLGLEIALCGRLIKGYGGTNDRGRDNLVHLVDHLALGGTFADPAARAAAIRAAREAALADDAGQALDRTLAGHGAPPRPVRAQPVVWVRKRPTTT